jgi:hypothetical protein
MNNKLQASSFLGLLLTFVLIARISALCVDPQHTTLDFFNQNTFDFDTVTPVGEIPVGLQSHDSVPFLFSNDQTIWLGVADATDNYLVIDIDNKTSVHEFRTIMTTGWGFAPQNVDNGVEPRRCGHIEFHYTDNTVVEFNYYGGSNIREWGTSGVYPQTLHDPKTVPAFSDPNGRHYDKQTYYLPPEAWSKTLYEVRIVDDIKLGSSSGSSLMVYAATVSECSVISSITYNPVALTGLYNLDWDGSGTANYIAPLTGSLAITAGDVPSGDVTFSGIPFSLHPAPHMWTSHLGPNYVSSSSETVSLRIDLGGVPNVVEFYTLINNFWGVVVSPVYQTLNFHYTTGEHYTYELIGAVNIRAHYRAADSRPQVLLDPLTEAVFPTPAPTSGARTDMQTIVLPTEYHSLALDYVELIDTGAASTSRVILFGATYSTANSCLPENSTSCDYEPPAPQVSAASDGSDYVINVTVTTTGAFDKGVTVTFPGSSTGSVCDLDSNALGQYWSTHYDVSCETRYEFRAPVSVMLGECGFGQRVVSNTVVFNHIAQVGTNRSCGGVRSEENYISRSTDFAITMSIPNNVTATVDDLEVFGNVFSLQLLGDLTVTPDIDSDIAQVSGSFVTSVQYPYMLEYVSAVLSSELNDASFTLSEPSCTADNTDRTPCDQTWDFVTNVSVTCADGKRSLDDWVNITFSVNCSLNFEGECAPGFENDAAMSFRLESSDYCVSDDDIQLIPSAEIYAYVGADTNPDFASTSVGDLPATGWDVERAFTFDSWAYGELTISSGSTVTLTGTEIVEIITQPALAGQDDITLFSKAGNIKESSTTIYDTGFGSPSTFSDTRSRFKFQWTAASVNVDSSIEESQTVAVKVTGVTTFTNVQSVRNTDGHPLLSAMGRINHEKERRDSTIHMFVGESGSRESGVVQLARIATASSNSNNPSSSTSKSDSPFDVLGGSSVLIGGVALLAVVALLAIVIIRRNNSSRSTESESESDDHAKQLPVTSSNASVELELNQVAMAYDSNANAPAVLKY